MPPETALNLTATDRVLLHLRDYAHHADDREYPPAMAQKGISEATGLRLTHVPRTLKGLEQKGLVNSAKAHVSGEKRRYNVYFLSEQGMAEVNRILENLKADACVRQALAECRGPVLAALLALNGEVPRPAKRPCIMAGPVPDTEGFVNRKNELAELGQMLDNPDVRVMVIYGSQGYGASALASRFVQGTVHRWSTVWVEAGKDLPGLLKTITETAAQALPDMDKNLKSPKKLAEKLAGSGIIMVLDGYFDASDEEVEFLTGFVAAIKGIEKFKLLVTAREDTPSYNRFYTIIDQHDGSVGEVHIRGLDIEHCQLLLGTPDIDPEAMKRLFMFTRGKPPTIRLLARGNEKELRQKTSFSPEEIKLMLFLKGQKRN